MDHTELEPRKTDGHYITVKPIWVETDNDVKICEAFVQDGMVENKAWRRLDAEELAKDDYVVNNIKWMPLNCFESIALKADPDILMQTPICVNNGRNSCFMDCDMAGATLINWTAYLFESGNVFLTGA